MPLWYQREAALPRCPLSACRRDQRCRHDTEEDPCRRLFQTQAQLYNAISDRLERMTREQLARMTPEERAKVTAEPGSDEFERRLKILYDSLRARDQEDSANEMAELARKRAAKAAAKPPQP